MFLMFAKPLTGIKKSAQAISHNFDLHPKKSTRKQVYNQVKQTNFKQPFIDVSKKMVIFSGCNFLKQNINQ